VPYLAFDIETALADNAKEYFAQKEYRPDPVLNAVDDPPSKITELKTQELREARLLEWQTAQKVKLEQSVLQQKQKDLDRAPLHWWTGKVICISAINASGVAQTWAGPDEQSVLQGFFQALATMYQSHTLVGKSSLFFDIPFLIGRAMAHDMGIPQQLRIAKEPVQDVNRIFSFSDSCPQVTSLKNYAWGLGLDGKLGEGSQVAEWYALGMTGDMDAWDKIRNYCVRDSEIVLEILKRYRKPFGIGLAPKEGLDDNF
jgi:hypothetical protein